MVCSQLPKNVDVLLREAVILLRCEHEPLEVVVVVALILDNLLGKLTSERLSGMRTLGRSSINLDSTEVGVGEGVGHPGSARRCVNPR